MKKLLLLFAVLLGTVGAWAQVSSLDDLSNDKLYTLKSGRSSGTTSHYLLYHEDAPNNLSSTYGSGHAKEYNDATANFHFAIYKNDDKYYFYNIAAAKFIGNNDNNNGAIPLVDYPTNAVEIRSSGNSTYNFVLSTNGTGALNAAATSGCHGVVNWTDGYNILTDAGNIYQITEVGELNEETKAIIEERINAMVNIVYNYYDGETLVGTETFESVSGFPYPQPTSLPGYVSCQIPDGTVSEGGTFNVQCTLKSDFPFSTTDYFGLSLRGGAKWFAVEEKTQILTTTGLSLANLPDAEKYSWILEGTWHSGFYLKHKTGMYVAAPNATPGNGAEAVLVEEKSDFAKFQIVLNGGKYYVKLYGTDNNCITDYGGNNNAKMKFWNSVWNFGDSGSQFAAEPVDADAILQAFKAENATTAGYVGGYDASIEEVNALTIYSVAEFVANTQRVELEVGKPYRIQNVQRNRMIGYDGTNRVPTSVGKAEISTVWSFENGATEGTYYIKNLNANAYMKAPDGGNDLVESNMASYNVPSLGQAQFNLGVGSNLLVDYGGNKGLGVWWGNGLDSDGAWYIIPATELDITVSDAGWATTCLPFDVVLPEELTAYALTDVSGVNGEETGSVSLISKAGIKAYEGALLKGSAGTYTLSIEETASNWDANLLSGTTVAKDMSTVTGDVYLLTSDGAGSAQLSKLTLADEATDVQKTLAANKAYLNIAPSATRYFVFNFGDDNATSIEGIEAENTADAVVYDLAGRRVQKAHKGLYIVNGKKVIK